MRVNIYFYVQRYVQLFHVHYLQTLKTLFVSKFSDVSAIYTHKRYF